QLSSQPIAGFDQYVHALGADHPPGGEIVVVCAISNVAAAGVDRRIDHGRVPSVKMRDSLSYVLRISDELSDSLGSDKIGRARMRGQGCENATQIPRQTRRELRRQVPDEAAGSVAIADVNGVDRSDDILDGWRVRRYHQVVSGKVEAADRA